jgi:lauroyl/myristoyl acyltransferase
MCVGDVNWLENDGKKEAAKTFAIALLESVAIAPEEMAQIAMHIVGRVNSIAEREREPLVENLEAHLRKTVRRWFKGEACDRPLGIVLWPYKVARRLGQSSGRDTMTPEQASAIYLEELDSVFGSS